jgi:hypothetical protein
LATPFVPRFALVSPVTPSTVSLSKIGAVLWRMQDISVNVRSRAMAHWRIAALPEARSSISIISVQA